MGLLCAQVPSEAAFPENADAGEASREAPDRPSNSFGVTLPSLLVFVSSEFPAARRRSRTSLRAVGNCTCSARMSRSPRASSRKPRRFTGFGSVVNAGVTALGTGYDLAGFGATSLPLALSTSVPRNRCRGCVRCVSMPSLKGLRARTKLRARSPFGVTRPAGGFGPAALPSMGSHRRTSIPSTACLDQFLEAAEVHEETAVHANAGGFLQGADGAGGTTLLECPVEHRDVRDGLRRHTGPRNRGTAYGSTAVRAWGRVAGTTMTRMRGDGRLC